MNSVKIRNNVKISGLKNAPTVILAHGFGCDQNVWRFMLPELEKYTHVVLFDYVGSGNSLISEYSTDKYRHLEGYANNIKDIVNELQLTDVTVIGHSVSATIAAIASLAIPQKIKKIVMICPSPCFLNMPPDYKGGFERSDLEELLELMDRNYIGWANYFAPLVMGHTQPQELIGELSGNFCSTDPIIAKTFAEATFFSDYRHILPDLTCATLILQSSSDELADIGVGQYITKNIENSEMVVIEGQGHCLHMTHHQDIGPIIRRFIE
ncbi:MAG: sigma-B regulation protein RsbQ [Paraglaciecola sp.]|jgi:sigma-B regulation protein RsbQ